MEAHAYIHTFEAVLKCKRLSLASSLINELDCAEAHPAYTKLGHHFVRAGNFDEAETCFTEGNQHIKAINMYIEAGIWDKADMLAQNYLSEDELYAFSRRFVDYYMYVSRRIGTFESCGIDPLIETCCVRVGEVVSMYTKNRLFDSISHMTLKSDAAFGIKTNEGIAELLEEEGNYKAALGRCDSSGQDARGTGKCE